MGNGAKIALAAGLLLGTASCQPEGWTTPAVPAACVEIGAHCRLPTGPIGVCQERPCPTGETAPCFACTPQH